MSHGVTHTGVYHLPDEVFNNARPLAALQQVYEQRPEAIWQIIVGLGVIEATSGRQDPDRAPGDLGFGASFIPKDDDEFTALQLKELKVRPALPVLLACPLACSFVGGWGVRCIGMWVGAHTRCGRPA